MADKTRLTGRKKPLEQLAKSPPEVAPGAALEMGAVADKVTVTDEALATLIGLAAHEVPGVIGMAPTNIREGMRRILGAQQADEGVEVARHGEGAASVDLHVAVAYGVNIPAVAESVKERVCYAAKTFAGITVTKVNVHVAGVGRAGR